MNRPRVQCTFFRSAILGSRHYHFRVTSCCTDPGKFRTAAPLAMEITIKKKYGNNILKNMSVFQVTSHAIDAWSVHVPRQREAQLYQWRWNLKKKRKKKKTKEKKIVQRSTWSHSKGRGFCFLSKMISSSRSTWDCEGTFLSKIVKLRTLIIPGSECYVRENPGPKSIVQTVSLVKGRRLSISLSRHFYHWHARGTCPFRRHGFQLSADPGKAAWQMLCCTSCRFRRFKVPQT